MQLIDGKKISEALIAGVAEKIKQQGLKLRLDVIIVGENPASRLYVNMKQKACENAGISSSIKHELPESASEKEIEELILELNKNPEVDGILLQLPLPKGLNEEKLTELISAEKDVDGMTSKNLGRLLFNSEGLVCCTPKGIVKLIESTGEELKGKNCVIVNHSRVIGKPLGLLLLEKNATVEFCHAFTSNLAEHTSRADVLITGVGKQNLIGKEHVKQGAIVIDAGISRTTEGKTVGDVNFEEVKEKAAFLTPVPGGVGPMTVACLLENTLIAGLAKKERTQKESE